MFLLWVLVFICHAVVVEYLLLYQIYNCFVLVVLYTTTHVVLLLYIFLF